MNFFRVAFSSNRCVSSSSPVFFSNHQDRNIPSPPPPPRVWYTGPKSQLIKHLCYGDFESKVGCYIKDISYLNGNNKVTRLNRSKAFTKSWFMSENRKWLQTRSVEREVSMKKKKCKITMLPLAYKYFFFLKQKIWK